MSFRVLVLVVVDRSLVVWFSPWPVRLFRADSFRGCSNPRSCFYRKTLMIRYCSVVSDDSPDALPLLLKCRRSDLVYHFSAACAMPTSGLPKHTKRKTGFRSAVVVSASARPVSSRYECFWFLSLIL